MENIKTGFKAAGPQKKNYFLVALVLFILAVLGLHFFNSYSSAGSPAAPQGIKTLSPLAFEQQYGLRVNLIAVTAAGGMVDLRLKMVDGDKAKSLLQDKNNLPALQVGRVTLNLAEDAKAQEIQFTDGGNLFLLYSNQGNTVKPGDSIRILFGNTALEPIQVQ
jgi:hypothetical protein